MKCEAAAGADFSKIRYAQCWEDADVLLEALEVRPGDHCLSIASAGDNALALLAKDPAKVVAIDLSPAQLWCLELRVAAYRVLEHGELLELVGSVASGRRRELYLRCRDALSPECRGFWDRQAVERGIGSLGKFERYFELFRSRVLPLIHGRKQVERLLEGGSGAAGFYDSEWDGWRWRLLFRVFFSRFVMGRAGRDPSFFKHVEGGVAERILDRTKHALTKLDPAANPYLQWILCGEHRGALPFALREENFEAIRRNLDRLEWRRTSIEDYLESAGEPIDRFNLSDIFEYMSAETCHDLLRKIASAGRPGGRLVYWNMLAPRRRPDSMASRLRPLEALAGRLHSGDKAFFYSALVIEEIQP